MARSATQCAMTYTLSARGAGCATKRSPRSSKGDCFSSTALTCPPRLRRWGRGACGKVQALRQAQDRQDRGSGRKRLRPLTGIYDSQ
jgi:hypothetical protein